MSPGAGMRATSGERRLDQLARPHNRVEHRRIAGMDRFNTSAGSDRAFWLQAYGGRPWA